MDLALTLDYELYGNGSGDVFKHIIQPTDRLLKIFDYYGAKITIFFEVVEYWRLYDEWKKGNKMGYYLNPCNAIEKQIKQAYKSGHDIQLHIHPQWINAKFINDSWVCDYFMCMNDIYVQRKKFFSDSLYDILKRGKDTIEKILHPINSDYKCNIFRAGAFNILPSEKVFFELKRLNFLADSSVYAGGFEINDFNKIDFRKINNRVPYWSVCNNNVLDHKQKYDKNCLLEIPIFSSPILRIMKYDLQRINIISVNKKSSFAKLLTRTEKRTAIEKIKYFLSNESLTWDYCLFNKNKMKKFIKIAQEINMKSKNKYHPFVLIGHSKGFNYSNSLKYLLKNKNLNFITLSTLIMNIKNMN